MPNPEPTNCFTSQRSGRRMMEDNLAKVFGFIVGVFLVCHTPRLLLGIHEAWITPNVIACTQAGRRAFPLWAVMFGNISHVMMAINSSVNGIIYGFISPQFRKALLKKAKKWGCYGRSHQSSMILICHPTQNATMGQNQAENANIAVLPMNELEQKSEKSESNQLNIMSETMPSIVIHKEDDSVKPPSTWPRVTRV